MATNPNMVAIQTVTVGSGGAANIEFTSIPQTYTDLCVVVSGRNGTATSSSLKLRFNSSSTGYSDRSLEGNGAAASSASNNMGTDYLYCGLLSGNGTTASTFGNTQIYIPNYTSSNNKSVSVDAVSENNAITAYALLDAGLWSNSAAITSITILPNSGAFAQYSTATLYGVTSAGTAAKATGGIITMDENYFYHTFLASGTFTPTQNLTADYLVVAGGGGGGTEADVSGNRSSGGGGGGGLRCTVTATGGGGALESPLSLTASTNYTVTIGAGGAKAANGSDSVFSSITSTGGGRGGNGGNSTNKDALAGGSGGGGGVNGAAGNGTTNQGYAGGAGGVAGSNGAGGGGGAGAAGTADSSSSNGNGGNGVATIISGTSTYYAGGGGAGKSAAASTGGLGGGGNGGSNQANKSGTAGTANTGGGGGGGIIDGSTYAAAAGGSGIVIVRYAR